MQSITHKKRETLFTAFYRLQYVVSVYQKVCKKINCNLVHKLKIRTYNSILMFWLLNFEALTSGVGGSLTVSLLILAALKLILCVIQL